MGAPYIYDISRLRVKCVTDYARAPPSCSHPRPSLCYYPSISCYPFCSNFTRKTCSCSCTSRSYLPLLMAYIRYSMRIITWNVAVYFICLALRVSFFSCDGMTLLTTWVLLRSIVIAKGSLLSVDKKEKPIFTVCSITRFTGYKHRHCTDTAFVSLLYMYPAFSL